MRSFSKPRQGLLLTAGLALLLWACLSSAYARTSLRASAASPPPSPTVCICTPPTAIAPLAPPLPTAPAAPLRQRTHKRGSRLYAAFVDRRAARHPDPTDQDSDEEEPMDSFTYWTYMGMIFMLVLVGGMFAGLTIGLMSIDETNLKILKRSGTPTEKIYAERIEPIRKNGHLLLVSLLLGNTIVNETLPILFSVVGLEGHEAVLFSTALILIFGEIIPQAVCARYGLLVGAMFAWPVRILIWLEFVIAYPIAKLLDYILGHKDGVIYRRAELKELIAMHDEDNRGPLNHEEVSILRAVLELRGKTAETVMTKLDDVLMLPVDAKFDHETVNMLIAAGHSRVPVYNKFREDIIGVVLIKQLISIDPDDEVPVKETPVGRLPRIRSDTPLFEILHVFEEGRSHMAVVVEEIPLEESAPRSVVTASPLWLSSPRCAGQRRFNTLGIITLEDVIEELIGQEIVDETDVYVDNNRKVKVARVLDIILSRENSSLTGSLIGSVDDEEMATERRPLLSPSGAAATTGYGAALSAPNSTVTKPHTSPNMLMTPRMKGGRRFRETLVAADVLLKEREVGDVAPVVGFEDGQRVLLLESGETEVDVPHLQLDHAFVNGSASTSSTASTHNLEQLD